MNFLAHIYLSGLDNELLLIGNFMGDFVKGSHLDSYPQQVQKGIVLHRRIDSFTDTHPLVIEAKQFFRLRYGLYSGVITDIVFDHFLSVRWKQFSKQDRQKFIVKFYSILQKHHRILPLRLQKLVPSLIHNQWVMHYASLYGTQKVLQRMSLRTSLPDYSKEAIIIVRDNYQELDALFCEFFGQLINHLQLSQINHSII